MAVVVNESTTLAQQARREWLLLRLLMALILIVLVWALSSQVHNMGGWRHVHRVGVARAFVEQTLAAPLASPSPARKSRERIVSQLVLVLVQFILVVGLVNLTWRRWIIIAGHGGERRVLETLRALPDEFYVLNDVVVPDPRKPAQIDHVLVSPYGLWCIETKAHRGRIVGQAADRKWTQVKHSSSGKRYTDSFYNPVKQNDTHCRRLGEYLSQVLHVSAPIKSVVVFTAADLKVQATVPVVKLRGLQEAVLREVADRCLADDQVSDIVSALTPLAGAR